MNGLKAEHLLKDRCIQELNDKVSELKVEALKFEGEAKKFEAMLEQQIKFNQQLEIAVRAYTTNGSFQAKPISSDNLCLSPCAAQFCHHQRHG